MLGRATLASLGSHERQYPLDHLIVFGTGVEIHCQSDLIDGVYRDLGHLIDRCLDPVEPGLVHIHLVQRSRARQRFEPAGQPEIGAGRRPQPANKRLVRERGLRLRIGEHRQRLIRIGPLAVLCLLVRCLLSALVAGRTSVFPHLIHR